ncbi:MAG: protease modulator HflC, partial [Alphaproteobacteria bacterium]
MKGTIKYIGLALAAAALFIVYSSVFVVDERQKALVIRLGQI